MEVPLEHLQPLARKGDEAQLTDYLNFASGSKLFCLNKKKADDITSLINNLLSSKETVNEGLLILFNFIDQCPRDVLSSNIVLWVQHAAKNLVNRENSSLHTVAFKVLGLLFELSSNFNEAKKQISLNVIPKVLDHFVRESKGNAEDVIILQTLEQTLKSFGRSCYHHRDALTKFIFTHLDSTPERAFVAGKCYLYLASIGAPGSDGENYIAMWQNQEKFLLNSLHEHLDLLFENIVETHDNHKVYKVEGTAPQIPEINEESLLKKKQLLSKLFVNLAEFFKILLLGSFPVRKRILPEAILGLAWRGLAVNHHTLSVGQQSIDTSTVMTVIAKVNYACLEIIEALLISCSMNLISYSELICRILTQALLWTEIEDWPYGVSKPHCPLRAKVYECLGKWINVSRACSGIEKYLDEVIPAVISDINHDPPAVSLKVPTGKGKKRNREMRAMMKAAKPALQFIVNPVMNVESCKAALKFTSELLNSVSTMMKPEQHKALQTAVVSKLITVQLGKYPAPYSDTKCRLALYEVLLSLCQNCHHAFQPPVSYATNVFSAGVKDTSVEVSNFCLFSLRSLEKILRPICPSLDFQVSDEGIERLKVSTAQVHTPLLNDSKPEKIKRKRFTHKVTSTPLNDGPTLSRLETPGVTLMRTGLQNLSDFEKGVNFSLEPSSNLNSYGASDLGVDNETYDVGESETNKTGRKSIHGHAITFDVTNKNMQTLVSDTSWLNPPKPGSSSNINEECNSTHEGPRKKKKNNTYIDVEDTANRNIQTVVSDTSWLSPANPETSNTTKRKYISFGEKTDRNIQTVVSDSSWLNISESRRNGTEISDAEDTNTSRQDTDSACIADEETTDRNNQARLSDTSCLSPSKSNGSEKLGKVSIGNNELISHKTTEEEGKDSEKCIDVSDDDEMVNSFVDEVIEIN